MKTISFTLPIKPTAKMETKYRAYILTDVSEQFIKEAVNEIRGMKGNKFNPEKVIREMIKNLKKSIRVVPRKEKKQEANEAEILWHLRKYVPKKVLRGPIFLRVTAFIPVAKSWTKKKKNGCLHGDIPPEWRPDLSNYVKQIEDCITKAGFWEDDARVVKYFRTGKYFAMQPRWEISIIALQED